MIAKPTSDHHFACLLLQTAPSLVIELHWSWSMTEEGVSLYFVSARSTLW